MQQWLKIEGMGTKHTKLSYMAIRLWSFSLLAHSSWKLLVIIRKKGYEWTWHQSLNKAVKWYRAQKANWSNSCGNHRYKEIMGPTRRKWPVHHLLHVKCYPFIVIPDHGCDCTHCGWQKPLLFRGGIYLTKLFNWCWLYNDGYWWKKSNSPKRLKHGWIRLPIFEVFWTSPLQRVHHNSLDHQIMDTAYMKQKGGR